MQWRTSCSWTLAIAAVLGPCADVRGQSPPPNEQKRRAEAGDVVEDAPVRLVPRRSRSERQTDAVEALALYSHGRMLQTHDRVAALRRFQRAWRYDPSVVSVTKEILPLTVQSNLAEETMRYLVIAAEQESVDSDIASRAAEYLADEKQYARAAALHDKAVSLVSDATSFEAALLRLKAGRVHMLAEQYLSAAEHFAQARQLIEGADSKVSEADRKKLLAAPDRIHAMMAEAALEADRLDEAEMLFKKVHAEKPNEAEFNFHLARVLRKREQHAEALASLEKSFASEGTREGLEPYQLLRELLAKTIPDEARAKAEYRERMERMHAAAPENALLGYLLAEQLLAAEDLPRAESLYEELIESRPAGEAFVNLATIHRKQGHVDKLLVHLGRTVLKAGSTEALGDEEAAISADVELLDKLVALRRSQEQAQATPGAALALALLAIPAKRSELAAELIQLALAEVGQPDYPTAARIWRVYGTRLFQGVKQGRAASSKEKDHVAEMKRSAEALQRAVDEDAAAKDAPYFLLAAALEFSSQTDKALDRARRGASLHREIPMFQGRVAWVLYHAKRHAEAEKAYLGLLERYKDDRSAAAHTETRQAKLALSNICLQLGRTGQAEEWLEQVLDESPEDTGALNDLGYLWTDQGKRLQRAFEMIQRAVRADPENLAYQDSLGWAYYRLGRFQEAVETLAPLMDREDGVDGVILDHLGDAYLAAKQTDEAIATWKRALAAFSEDDAKQRAKTEEKLKQHSP